MIRELFQRLQVILGSLRLLPEVDDLLVRNGKATEWN